MTGLRVPPGANRPPDPDTAPATAPAPATDPTPAMAPAPTGPAPGSGAGTAGSPQGSGPGRARARLSAVGWLRWGWRQLTSMRTALVLLFLLAVGSVPGSVLPQQGIDPSAVTQYYASHPALAPVLARLSLFNVFAAPWFAAIYLLLFASLAGCVLPRTIRLVGSARQQPPRAPRNLSRLPLSVSYRTPLEPAQALASAERMLAGKRFRLRTADGWVSAEKGYLREVGNLLFHLALLALLGSVGLGGIFGYKANRLLVTGDSFANTVTALDQFRPGRLVSASDLQPFSLTLENFSASYVTSGEQRGQPEGFNAALRYSPRPGAPQQSFSLRVNHPLDVDDVRVFLIGHGYAPEFRVTDGTGHVVFNDAVPFIPVEQAGLTSDGVLKVPDASPQQLGFAGVFLPTSIAVDGTLESAFPAALNPRVSLLAYAGNLGMNAGQPQSVYQLNTSGLHRLSVAPQPLAVGQSMKLPHGAGTLTFVGYKQWISLAITYDPGQLPALLSGIAAIAGLLLSFMVRRRRVFVRAYAGLDGGTVVDVGGLARSDAAGGFEIEFAGLAAGLSEAQEGGQLTSSAEPDAAQPDATQAAGPGTPAKPDTPDSPANRDPSLRDQEGE